MTGISPANAAQGAAAASPLFVAGAFRAAELGAPDIARLQHFFEGNPEYFQAVSGQPASANEAHDELHGAPPPDWPYTQQWVLGFEDEAGMLVGMASLVSDLLAPAVWHIGLFMVATRLHGAGAAHTLYAALEHWMRANGAQWGRLGVVVGNARAERFWERCGFVATRVREGIEMGQRVNAVRVMAKPLAGGTLSEYLARVPRDRPES